jgi:dephospho-CoA kinase
MSPFVIALTGGIGSGKSSVADLFRELGVVVVDTDEISRRLTSAGQPGANAIAEQFGAEYLDGHGALARERMRELVFSDVAAKQKLEAILHPMIRARVRDEVAAAGASSAPYVVIAVPLLVETGAYRDLAKRVLVVDCDENKQIERVMKRSGLSSAAVRAIMANQAARGERLGHADDVLHNDAGMAELRAGVVALHRKYVALAGG